MQHRCGCPEPEPLSASPDTPMQWADSIWLSLLTAADTAWPHSNSACRPNSLEGDLWVLQCFAIDFVSRSTAFCVAGRRKGGIQFIKSKLSYMIQKSIQAGEGVMERHLAPGDWKYPLEIIRWPGWIIYLGELYVPYQPVGTVAHHALEGKERTPWFLPLSRAKRIVAWLWNDDTSLGSSCEVNFGTTASLHMLSLAGRQHIESAT